MLLVDLNCNFECDWCVELFDNKLGKWIGGKWEFFFRPITIEEIVIFYDYSGNIKV